MNLHFLLSGGVIESMEKGDFFNEKVTKSILFSSVHDAVLYCQQGSNGEVQYFIVLGLDKFELNVFCMFLKTCK